MKALIEDAASLDVAGRPRKSASNSRDLTCSSCAALFQMPYCMLATKDVILVSHEAESYPMSTRPAIKRLFVADGEEYCLLSLTCVPNTFHISQKRVGTFPKESESSYAYTRQIIQNTISRYCIAIARNAERKLVSMNRSPREWMEKRVILSQKINETK